MTDKKEIELFLKEIKEKINFFDVVFRPRDKNLESLAFLDITPLKRVEFLMNLHAENYNSGPRKDTYDVTKPDYYEFGIQIKGKEVYIKITVA